MCTFAHDLVMMFVKQLQNYQKGLTPRIGISPNFYFSRLACVCIYVRTRDEVLADNNNKKHFLVHLLLFLSDEGATVLRFAQAQAEYCHVVVSSGVKHHADVIDSKCL